MKLRYAISIALTAVLASPAIRADEELTKDGKKAVKAAVRKARDDAEVPPELRTPRIDGRTEKMRQLILQGLKDGTLSQGEARLFASEIAGIERDEKSAKHDDEATRRERKKLNRKLEDLHERIWAKTHNGAKPTEPLGR